LSNCGLEEKVKILYKLETMFVPSVKDLGSVSQNMKSFQALEWNDYGDVDRARSWWKLVCKTEGLKRITGEKVEGMGEEKKA